MFTYVLCLDFIKGFDMFLADADPSVKIRAFIRH